MITTGILPWWPTSPPYTFRLHPFMDTGFQGAIGRPRPLSPQGLCLLLSALAVLFAQAPAGLRPTCREVSTQRHYHTAPSEILLLKAAAQPRHTFSSFCFVFPRGTITLYNYIFVRLLLVCLSCYTANSTRARTPFIYN